MSTPPDSAGSEGRRKPFPIKRAILLAGLACFLQFYVFAGIGVARGYSIQSWAPIWIMLAGVFLLMPFHRKHHVLSFLSSAAIIVYALVSLSQGRHHEKGKYLYVTGEFADAAVAYRKEINTWYLRLIHNHREAPCMFGIAQCQSQMEQFEEARETYAAMTSMFRGYYKTRAEDELAALDSNLQKVAELEKAIAAEEDEQERAMLLFDLALAYRGLNCSGKAIEQYEKIQSLEIDERFQKQARRFAGALR